MNPDDGRVWAPMGLNVFISVTSVPLEDTIWQIADQQYKIPHRVRRILVIFFCTRINYENTTTGWTLKLSISITGLKTRETPAVGDQLHHSEAKNAIKRNIDDIISFTFVFAFPIPRDPPGQQC